MEFNEAELSNLHLLIANTITSSKKINYEQLTMRNIHDYVDQRFIDITKDLLKKVEDNYLITTDTENFASVRNALEENGVKEFLECELTYIPNMEVTLDDEGNEKVHKLVDALEELDDVQDVYYNLKED